MSDNVSASEALVKRIISEAEDKAAMIAQSAKDYYDLTVQKADREAKEIVENAKLQADARCKEIKRARATLSAIETKKTFLTAKQNVVEEVFSRAIEKLEALDPDGYLKLIDKLLKTYAAEGDEVIVSEKAPVTVQQVRDLDLVKKLSLKVKKTGEFGGGIVLSGKAFDKDLSFKALCEAEKEKTETEIAKKLFG